MKKQKGGTGSTNLQADKIIIQNNYSVTKKQIQKEVLNVFKQNFIKLGAEAAEIASRRAEDFIEQILLKSQDSDLTSSFNDPGVQAAIFSAQVEYAKTGDKDLEEMLLDIIKDRILKKDRDFRQIVLDESLKVASKLTPEHLDVLTLNFIITQTINQKINNLESFSEYIKTYFVPFIKNLIDRDVYFEHLVYAGCASISMESFLSIEELFQDRYRGLFSNGFTIEEFSLKVGSDENLKKFLTPCLNDKLKMQINAINGDVLEKKLKEKKCNDEIIRKFRLLFNESTMNIMEIKDKIISIDPLMDELIGIWKSTKIKNIFLTSVGVSLAQANFRRRTDIKLDLSIWIK